MSLIVRHLKGEELEKSLPDLARLRIEVFRDFPYLYEGSLDYEQQYLSVYTRSPRSAVIAVYDGDLMVGAATALPLLDESSAFQEPFLQANIDLSKVFYFGESVLLKKYRGQGIGHIFFDEREKVARQSGDFEITCFCAVQRPEDHPARPLDFRPLDDFWMKRGYQKAPDLTTLYSWQDLGETVESQKKMIFWLKEWNS